MSEPRLCCNCLHCARWKKKDGIECHCDLNDKYLGYLTVMDEENDCKHWEKETKWDLQREHDKQIRADAIEEYKIALHTKYKENKAFAYSVWEGNIYKYDAMANLNLEEIDEIAEQLKEQNNES